VAKTERCVAKKRDRRPRQRGGWLSIKMAVKDRKMGGYLERWVAPLEGWEAK